MKTTSPMWHVAAIMEPEHLDRAATLIDRSDGVIE
jgi:hypothetical protein